MASESPFLDLPRELRDAIYRFYVTFEDGLVYRFDYGSTSESANILGNLAPANKKHHIDHALSSTCKQINRELEGLILKFNTITFSNTHISRMNSDEVRVRAARFHYLRVPLTMDAAAFLYYEDDTIVRPCYTSTVVDVSQQTNTPLPARPTPRSSCYCIGSHINLDSAGSRTYSPFNWPVVTHYPQHGHPLG